MENDNQRAKISYGRTIFPVQGFLATASPSDVRRWLCPAANRSFKLGAMPRRGEAPILEAPMTEGHSRFRTSDGKAQMDVGRSSLQLCRAAKSDNPCW